MISHTDGFAFAKSHSDSDRLLDRRGGLDKRRHGTAELPGNDLDLDRVGRPRAADRRSSAVQYDAGRAVGHVVGDRQPGIAGCGSVPPGRSRVEVPSGGKVTVCSLPWVRPLNPRGIMPTCSV